MSPTGLLLGAIVVLTVAELAAVLVISLYGAKDQTTILVGILVGIVGPVVASLVAVVTSASAHAKAGAAETKADAAQTTADAAQSKADQVEQTVNSEGLQT